MALRVYGPRRIEHAECTVGAVKRVELGQSSPATRLNPGDLETILVLRAQSKDDRKDEERYNGQSSHIKGRLSLYLIVPSANGHLAWPPG
jgi:hypothetical protein